MIDVDHEDNRNMCSNFSIDHILNRAGTKTCNTYSKVDNSETVENHVILEDRRFEQYTYHWLNCTRYDPPKLQRPQKREGVKRQPGRHPRIPFTANQIEVLEESYKKSQYLCPEEVKKLSVALDLSDTRIKIWFQNRRAREKRERDGIHVCSTNPKK